MAIGDPLNVSNSIQVAALQNIKAENKPLQTEKTSSFGDFQNDIVEISDLGQQKQQNETQQQASSEIKALKLDVVRVTSSIGKSRSAGNLTAEQAADLYNQIAALL